MVSFGPDHELFRDQQEDMAAPDDMWECQPNDHEWTLNVQESYEWCQICDSVRPVSGVRNA